MLNIGKIPNTPKNKVNKFFGKARKKFTDRNGILFVGCGKIQDYHVSSKNLKLNKLVELMIGETGKKFEYRNNEKIDAVVFVFMDWFANPEKDWETDINRFYIIIPRPEEKGGFRHDFFSSLLDVDKTSFV